MTDQSANSSTGSGVLDLDDEVRRFIDGLVRHLRRVLAHALLGVFPYGSLALGDFDPESSDIDLVVATLQSLDSERVEALRDMHMELARAEPKWSARLEVSYPSLHALRQWDPQDSRHPFVSTVSPFGILQHGPDWIINYWVIRERARPLLGPAPSTLIDPISPENLQQAVRTVLCSSWSQHVDGPEWMRPRKYQSFTVLTLCRMWHTVERGEVASKPQAAAWASERLPEGAPVIEKALVERSIADVGDMTDALAFLKYTLETHCG